MEPKNILRLSEKELPEIKDWEVGKTYEVVLTVKQMSKRQGSEWDTSADSKEVQATFEIVNVEVEEDDNDEDDTNDSSDMENYEGEYASKRAKSNN